MGHTNAVYNRAGATYPIFVYGTLKAGGCNYARYLAGKTLHEQPATLAGAALYTAGPYPYLVRLPELVAPSEDVQGTLMTIKPAVYVAVLRHVDQLESYVSHDPANEYERIVGTVQTATGPVDAWMYVAGARVLAAIRRQSASFWRVKGSVWVV